MWRVWAIAVVGCGRLGFGPDSDAGGDTGAAVAGPEAWYRCEDAPIGALDASGNGHTASCPTACPTIVAGHVGNACDFAGGAYLSVAEDGRFRDDTAVTLAAWMRTRSAQVNQALVSKVYASLDTNSWQLEVEGPARACASGPYKDCADNVVTWGPWQHYAATYDGTVKRLYVDGVERGMWNEPLAVDDHDLVLGADYRLDSAGNFSSIVVPLDGELDEVMIYGRALSAAEIATLAAE